MSTIKVRVQVQFPESSSILIGAHLLLLINDTSSDGKWNSQWTLACDVVGSGWWLPARKLTIHSKNPRCRLQMLRRHVADGHTWNSDHTATDNGFRDVQERCSPRASRWFGMATTSRESTSGAPYTCPLHSRHGIACRNIGVWFGG